MREFHEFCELWRRSPIPIRPSIHARITGMTAVAGNSLKLLFWGKKNGKKEKKLEGKGEAKKGGKFRKKNKAERIWNSQSTKIENWKFEISKFEI